MIKLALILIAAATFDDPRALIGKTFDCRVSKGTRAGLNASGKGVIFAPEKLDTKTARTIGYRFSFAGSADAVRAKVALLPNANDWRKLVGTQTVYVQRNDIDSVPSITYKLSADHPDRCDFKKLVCASSVMLSTKGETLEFTMFEVKDVKLLERYFYVDGLCTRVKTK